MSSSDTNTGITITDAGIAIPEAIEIRNQRVADLRAVWGQDLDVSPYTPQGQIIDSETAIINDKNSQLQFILNQLDPEKNEGIWQEGIGKIYFITRKPAQPTAVVCQVVGLVNTIIPAGSLVQDDSGLLYAASDDFIITSPSPMNLTFVCTTPGPIECPAGTINRIYSMIPGWDTVSNAQAGVTGSNVEGRVAFEHRRYEGVAKNAHGNMSSIWGAIADLNDVISVQMEENTWNVDQVIRGVLIHGHSVFISVVGGTDQNIAKVIYQRKDGGCGMDGNTDVTILIPTFNSITTQKKVITFNRPTQVRAAIKINIGSNENTVSNIEDLLKDAIHKNWDGLDDRFERVQIGDMISASRFYPTCLDIGADYYDLVRIRIGRANANGAPVTWTNAMGFTLDEYPIIQDSDIYVVSGEDPDDVGLDDQFWEYDEATGTLTPKPISVTPVATSATWQTDTEYLLPEEQTES